MSIYINLLPLAERRRNLLVRRLWQWLFLGGLTCVIMGLVYVQRRDGLADIASIVEARERAYLPIRQLNDDLDAMQNQLVDLRELAVMASDLIQRRPSLTVLGIVSRSAAMQNGRLQVQQFSLNPGRTGARPSPPTLELGGIALEQTDVASFVSGLQAAGVFTKVTIENSEETDGESGMHDYTLTCSY